MFDIFIPLVLELCLTIAVRSRNVLIGSVYESVIQSKQNLSISQIGHLQFSNSVDAGLQNRFNKFPPILHCPAYLLLKNYSKMDF